MTRSALVVDDAATVRLYHRSILQEAGFEVVEAANGFEGLEAALCQAFDLLIVDVNMPRLDGYALVEAVRRDGLNIATPIIMISTESNGQDSERAYAVGVNVYVTKPVTAQQLALLADMVTGAAK